MAPSEKSLLPELGHSILDHLLSELDSLEVCRLRDARLLRILCKCTLVCKHWHRRCRPHIFSTVYIENDKGLASLQHVLDTSPSLRPFVKRVNFQVQEIRNTKSLCLNPDGVPIRDVLMFIRKVIPQVLSLGFWSVLSLNTETPLPFTLDKITRSCLANLYTAVSQLSVEEISASRVGHQVYSLPSLRRLKCRNIKRTDDRPILCPDRHRLFQFDVCRANFKSHDMELIYNYRNNRSRESMTVHLLH